MPSQNAPSEMVVQRCCHCAMRIVSQRINSSATMIGCYSKRSVIVACHWRPEDTSDCLTASRFHVTIARLRIQHAPGLDSPTSIPMISHVSYANNFDFLFNFFRSCFSFIFYSFSFNHFIMHFFSIHFTFISSWINSNIIFISSLIFKWCHFFLSIEF